MWRSTRCRLLTAACAVVLLVGVSGFVRVLFRDGVVADNTTPAEDGLGESQLPEPTLSFPQPLDQMPAAITADQHAAYSFEAPLDWRANAGYAGSSACRECHPEQFASYQRTDHSRALSDVEPGLEPPDAEFDHPASGRRYRVVRREGRLFHEESLPLDDGTEFVLTSTPLRYRVGSGHFARTYLCDAGGGFLLESPVTWYESAEEWSMTPGFDRAAHRSFSRQILENCMWCHAGQVETSTTSTIRLRIVEQAIGCERCHGPGQAHVDWQRAGGTGEGPTRDSIVNPRSLSRKLAEAICQQCHLQGDIQIGGRNVRAGDYRPGRPLEQFATVFRLRRPDSSMTVVGHVEQLAASPCATRSETLSCLTCHNPHRPVEPGAVVEHYRSICLSCHQDRGCRLPLEARQQKSQDDCVACHMPRSATEVPHVAFTHHRIGIHPLSEAPAAVDDDPLIPLSDLASLSDDDRERSMSLARIEMFLLRGPVYQRSPAGRTLLRQIDRWLQSLEPQASDVEIEFARVQLSLARDDLPAAEESAARVLAFENLRGEEEAGIQSQLGQIDLRQGRFDQARLRFGRLTQLRSSGQDWFCLALCEEKRGHVPAAIAALERARQLEPGGVGIYQALSRLADRRSDPATARQMRDSAQRLERGLRAPRPASRGDR